MPTHPLMKPPLAALMQARWLRVLTAFSLGMTVLTAIVVLGFATPPGRALLAGIVERAASTNGLVVKVGTLSGWPPFDFGADKIVLADAGGSFAEIDNLVVDLRGTALLHGDLAFDAITADRVAIARKPDLPPTPPAEDMFPVTIDRLAVRRVEVGAPLIGHDAVLALGGSFASGRDGSLLATITAERKDGTTAKLDAAIQRKQRAAPLAIDARLEEGADGILVGLLGRPGGPAYRLAAKTDVAGDSVSGTVVLASTGTAKFDGRFSFGPVMAVAAPGASNAPAAPGAPASNAAAPDVAPLHAASPTPAPPSAGARRVQLTGAGDLAELLPADYVDLLTGPIAIDIDADFTAAAKGQALPHIAIRKGTLRAASFAVQATGALGDTSADLALKLDLAQPAGGAITLPGAAARLDAAALTGTVTRTGDILRLDIAGRIDALRVADAAIPRTDLAFAVTSAGRDPLAGGKLPYALRIAAPVVDTPAGRIPAAGGQPLVFTAEGTFDTAQSLAETTAALAIEGGRATFVGTLDARAGRGTATAAFPDLRPLARFAGSPLSGGLEATAEGAFYARAGTSLKVQATATNLDVGTPLVARLLGGRTQLAGNVARQADGTIALTNLALDGAAVKVNGRAAFGAANLALALDGRLADLALLADSASGAAQFTVNASGAKNRPLIDATVKVDKGSLAGKPIERANVQLQGKPSDTGWAGTIALAGSLAGKRLAGTANAALERTSGLLAFPKIDLALGDNRITGALQRTAQGPLSGALEVAAPDVATLAALALVEASGAAEAKVAFTPDGPRQVLAIRFTGTRLGIGTTVAGKIDGDVNIDDAFGTPKIRGNVSASALAAGGLVLDAAKASATLDGSVTKFSAAAKGTDLDLAGSGSYGPAGRAAAARIDGETSGAARGDRGASVLTVATLTGTAYKLPVRLAAPVAIRIDGAQVAISGARIAIGGGTITLDGAAAPEMNLVVVADKLAAATANIFSPALGAEGTLTGRAKITGKAPALSIAWQVEGSGLRAAATRSAGLPPLAVSGRGDATLAATSVDAKITGAGGLAFTVVGQIPYSGAGLNVRAEGTAPLALLALEAGRELRLAGNARINVNATGALDAPQLAGNADLVDATLIDAETGFGVAGTKGRITFDGHKATLEQISGRLVQGGQITIGGTIDIVATGLPAALTLRVENGRYADGRVINAGFDANLALNGPLLGNGTVSGTLALGRTEIQLPEKLAGSRTAIDVSHVNAPASFKSPQARRNPAAGAPRPGGDSSLRLALEITNSRGIFVRGFGVDAEFGGAVKVAGTVGDPRAAGDFTMRRGRIEVLGKRFNLASGTLTFAGDLVPIVEFVATAATTSATVTMNVSGPADDPKITFSSSPDLPQEEVLSRLLFERSVGSLSPLQAAQLIDAIAQFTGVGGSGGIFGRIRQATGLDDLDVRQNATGGTTVGVSKSVNDNVRLGVEAGSGTTPGRVTIDLELSKNLKARGEAGQDGSGKIGLTYEREY